MNTRFGHVTYTKLGIRHSSLKNFCKDFEIDILGQIKSSVSGKLDKDSILEDNFVYFLLENKTFIRIYNLDYYSDKSIEIISNKIGRKPIEIENYLENRNYNMNDKYPFRFLSSYEIDFKLGANYNFTKFEKSHIYCGNFELRRSYLKV